MYVYMYCRPLRETEMLSPPNKNSLPFFHNLAITPGKTESNIVVQFAHNSQRVGCVAFLNFQGLATLFQGSLQITLGLQYCSNIWMTNQSCSCLSPSRNQQHRALEYAPLSWDLACLPYATCSSCAESKPTARALGWQRTVVSRDSGRIGP